MDGGVTGGGVTVEGEVVMVGGLTGEGWKRAWWRGEG